MNNSPAPFVHLDIHTAYSLGEGIVRVEELAKQASAAGMPAIGITDTLNVYAAVKFFQACLRYGVKPLLGVDVEVNEGGGKGLGQLILLCKNNAGYRAICELLTDAYTSGVSGTTVLIGREKIESLAENLIAISPGIDGEIGRLLKLGKQDDANQVIKYYSSVFPDSFYVDITRTGQVGEEEFEAQALKFAKNLQVPLVAGNVVRFLQKDDFVGHDIRVCIARGSTLDDPRRSRNYTESQYLKSAENMSRLFRDIPSALKNTVEIAKRCNVFFDLKTTHMPAYPSFRESTEEELLVNNSNSGLRRRIDAGQVSETESETYNQRLNREITIITQMGFSGYFLIVADFVKWASDNEIPVGPGRGSGAGSLVAYVLGITQIDPIRYGLLFERFLNPERVSLPDFDIDFCMNGRDRVIDYVAKKYGTDRVAQIITYNTLAARAVVRDVGRVMGQPYGYCDSLAKMIPFEVGMTLDKALEQDEGFKSRYSLEVDVAQLVDNAKRLEGLPRNAGKHAGGLVIAPQSITRYTPLYWEPGMNQPVTQFDKDDLEAIGLVKFDFLGLRTLTVIDRAMKDVNRIRKNRSLGNIRLEDLPLDDPKVYEAVSNGKTSALFQLESRGMQELIQRLKPDHFEELIALVALFRPGPLQSGMVDDFIDRKHGREKVRYPHPALEEILQPTYGVILYQEQVMEIARVLSGYTLGSADLLRRAMGKKKPEEMRDQRKAFIDGALERQVDIENAGYIFELIEKFAGYGFNKSHSAAYALLSYQTAWLKTYYPTEFMAASLSADMEHTEKIFVLVTESKRMGLKILPPDVNESDFAFKVEASGKIRYGLGAIKGAGEKAIESLVSERAVNGSYLDLYSLCRRVDSQKVNKKVYEALIMSGALDALECNRAAALASLPTIIDLAGQLAENRSSGQNDMFGLSDVSPPSVCEDQVEPWSEKKALDHEHQSLGLYLTGHPVEHAQKELAEIISGRISSINPVPKRRVVLSGLARAVRVFNNRKGETAAFFTLDDGAATADISVVSSLFQRVRSVIQMTRLIVVIGDCSLDETSGQVRLDAEQILSLAQIRESALRQLTVAFVPKSDVRVKTRQLQSLLDSYRPGRTAVQIRYGNQHSDEICIALGPTWCVNPEEELIDRLCDAFGVDSIEFGYDRQFFGSGRFLESSRAA